MDNQEITDESGRDSDNNFSSGSDNDIQTSTISDQANNVPAVQDQGKLVPAVQDRGKLVPAVQDQGKLVPVVQDQGNQVSSVETSKIIQGTQPTYKEQIWTKKDYRTQIKSLENQLSIILKVSKEDLAEDGTHLTTYLKGLYNNFEENKFSDLDQNIIYTKAEMYRIVNKMGWKERVVYNVSLWGISPIVLAVIAMIFSYSLIIHSGSFVILDVPLWASFIAVIGASVQILIGVVNDYKADCKITEYKRLWYIVLPFVSFVFGFIAFLLTNAGLISMTLGQIASNQTASMSVVSALPSGLSGGSTIHPPAILITICFLAGYSTNWFMGLLLKYTSRT